MKGTFTCLPRVRRGPSAFLPATRLVSTKSGGEHRTLSDFLDYASQVSLDRSSTVFQGTCYEYIARDALARFGLNLRRSGGRLDKGIDLLGAWPLPTLPDAHPLNIIVQCKSLSKKLGPNHVREMEGAFAGAPAAWRVTGDAEKQPNTVGILVAPKEATKGVRDAMSRSQRPLAFAMIEHNGRTSQIFWNKAAASIGLDAVQVQVRRAVAPTNTDLSSHNQGIDDSSCEEIVLLFGGHVLSQPPT